MAKSSGGIRRMAEAGAPYRETPSQKIARVIDDIRRDGYSKVTPFSVGEIESRMSAYAASNGIELPSKTMYMSHQSIAHALRDSKAAKGLTVDDADLIAFPSRRLTMDLYYDGKVFVYTDYKTKYVVNPSYELKIDRSKKRKVAFVTAGKTDGTEFKLRKYVKV